MGLVHSIPHDSAKVVQLAPCPYCSRPQSYPQPQINRPVLVNGRNGGKVFIVGCCSFSGSSWTPYDNGQDAIDAWNRYRVIVAKALASKGNYAILPRLGEIDQQEFGTTDHLGLPSELTPTPPLGVARG